MSDQPPCIDGLITEELAIWLVADAFAGFAKKVREAIGLRILPGDKFKFNYEVLCCKAGTRAQLDGADAPLFIDSIKPTEE